MLTGTRFFRGQFIVRLEIEILAIQHLLYVPCLVSDAVIAVEVHSCMDVNPKIAVAKKKNSLKNLVGFRGILAARYTVNIMNLG